MGREDVSACLRASPVFGGLPPEEIDALVTAARKSAFAAREHIFREGDPALWLCVLVSGRVKIVKHSRAGKDVVLEILGPGEVFGGVAVVDRQPYPAAAQAVEASVVVKIPAETLLALTRRQPSVVKEMALMIGRRLRAAHDALRALAVDPAEVRLAGALLRIAEREGRQGTRGLALPFHLTRQSLADMSGTTVETTIRIVSRWHKEGLVVDEGGRLILTNVAAFRERAGKEAD